MLSEEDAAVHLGHCLSINKESENVYAINNNIFYKYLIIIVSCGKIG